MASAQAPGMSEWREYAREAGQRYSPLSQIDASNVSLLTVAWEWEGETVLGEESEYRNQSTPLMVDGVMYFSLGTQRSVVAADARTGATKWVWSYEDERIGTAPRASSGRGVSFWSDGTDERIFVVSPGYRLFALDPQTGRQITSFGDNGEVDLRKLQGVAEDAVIGASSPAAVYQDVVIIGPALAVGLVPPSRENVLGAVLAIDARTGAERWRFNTIPGEGEFGVETWENDSWRYTGNAGVWAPITVDRERGIAYLPVEAATGDYYGGHRLGDNLFSSSLVAVDALTGERIWHFQVVRHDIFDWDNPTAPILVDFALDGREVHGVVQLTKQAMAYVFDRYTGEPIWPMLDTPVPVSDTPGERSAPTQPVPTKPAPYDRKGFTLDDLVDFTPALRAEALEAVRPFRLGGIFPPASLRDHPADGTQGTLALPGTLGGTNWEGGAFDPETGMLYVGSHTTPSILSLVPGGDRSDMDYVLAPSRVPQVQQNIPVVKPPYSRITAIDLNTGEHAWMVAAGDTPEDIRNNPALEGVDLPRTGSPGARPVTLVTRSLVFVGEGQGGQPFLHALDKATGETVFSFELPAPVTSIPMSYAVDGRQYLSFWIGGVAEGVQSRLVTLALAEPSLAQEHPHGQHPPEVDPLERVVLEGPHLVLAHQGLLGLTGTQATALRRSGGRLCAAEMAYVRGRGILQRELSRLLSEDADEARLARALERLAEVEVGRRLARVRARREARTVLGPEQRELLDWLGNHWEAEARAMIVAATRPGHRGHPGVQQPIRVPGMVVEETFMAPFCEALHGPAVHISIPPPR
ncbi:MAG: PQQ-binding-like beta-propeller repeat protein [Gemmatimonadota bacterium]